MRSQGRIILTFVQIFILALLSAGQVHAQSGGPFAVVDIDRLMGDSKAGRSIQNQLQDSRESFQKEFSEKEQELREKEKSILQQRDDLSAEEFAKKRQEFESSLLETRKLFQQRRNALDEALNEAMIKLRKEIVEISANLAEEKGYSMILSRENVVIVEKDLDVTDEALKRLNKNIQKIDLKVE